MLDWRSRRPGSAVVQYARSAETGASYSLSDADGAIRLLILMDGELSHVVICETAEWARRLAGIFDAGLALVLAGVP